MDRRRKKESGEAKTPGVFTSLCLLPLAVGSVCVAGCAQLAPTAHLARPPRIVRAAGPETTPVAVPVVWQTAKEPAAPIRRVSTEDVTHLPPPAPEPLLTPPIAVPRTEPPQVVPVSLDTVFRLAEEQNAQVALARERVREAYAEKRVAASRWLPDLYFGTAFYRHEGGIQDFDGALIRSSTGAQFAGLEINSQIDIRDYAYQKVNAQRKVWQQKGELRKITTETLMEAANTYIDMLTARSGEAIARDMDKKLKALLERARLLAEQDMAARIEVSRIEAEFAGQQQTILKVREQAAAASAKLAYLLGIDPCTEMIPVDRQVMPIELVDASPATCELVSQVLASGPGVQELEGLLALIHESMERAQGCSRWLPVVGVRMAEGGFGAGAGDQLTWDNRWDLGLQARWNLTEFITRRDRQRAAQAKMQQAHLAYDDLRGKLTAGVQEARGAILSGHQQIAFAQDSITAAQRAHELSDERLKKYVAGATYSEVLLSIRSLALAQFNYLTAVNAYDKAQIRLMVLLGPGSSAHVKYCPQ